MTYRTAADPELPGLIKEVFKDCKLISKKKIKYYNAACAFDTESSSFIDSEGNPAACLYLWQLGLNEQIIITGRTYPELMSTLSLIADILKLGASRRLIVYVHNLSWDFQFIAHHIIWDNIFALAPREVVYAEALNGIIFKCSYILTGDSLAHVATTLREHDISKLSGALDYTKIRHSDTPLTFEEYWYGLHDIKVIMFLIAERITEDGNILKIPLTKTGYVRKDLRARCLTKRADGARGNGQWHRYRALMNKLQLSDDDYRLLTEAFAGGFTHASARRSGRVWHNVRSLDATSDYPDKLCVELYPMSPFYRADPQSPESLNLMLNIYACLFRCTFYGIDEKITADHPISASRCLYLSPDAIIDNGRVVSADCLRIACTEIDFKIYTQFYTFDSYDISDFRYAYKGYLPKPIISGILEWYSNKTTLKGIADMSYEYDMSKRLLNSTFGMMVENPVRDNIAYIDGEWIRQPPELHERIEIYNNKMSRFTFYPWGVWCTAHARAFLFDAIAELGPDYIYADTDSVKILNYDKHRDYFERVNKERYNKCIKAAEYHRLSPDLFMPKNNKGVPKCMGLWDDEYKKDMARFKTLGAKRYMYELDDTIHIVVSGLRRDTTEKYITSQPSDPFDFFRDGMRIPAGYSGRNIHTYIDYPISGTVRDYLGNQGEYNELSAVHLSASDYNMSLSAVYADYILNLSYKEDYT